jgi:hypothetical protein
LRSATFEIHLGIASVETASMNHPVITREILQGYLHCRYLAHLRLTGHEGQKSDYEKMLSESHDQYQRVAIDKLRVCQMRQGVAVGADLTPTEPRKVASLILSPELRDDDFCLQFDALSRLLSPHLARLRGFDRAGSRRRLDGEVLW